MNPIYLHQRTKKCADLVSFYTCLNLQNLVVDASEDMGLFTAFSTLTPKYLAVNIQQMPVLPTIITLHKDLGMENGDTCGCFIIGMVGSKPVTLNLKGGKGKELKDILPFPINKLGSRVIFIMFPLRKDWVRKTRLLESAIKNADSRPELIIQASKMQTMDFPNVRSLKN